MSDIAIKVSNLTKIYKLYDKPTLRLKEALSVTKKKYHKDFQALNDVSFEIQKEKCWESSEKTVPENPPY